MHFKLGYCCFPIVGTPVRAYCGHCPLLGITLLTSKFVLLFRAKEKTGNRKRSWTNDDLNRAVKSIITEGMSKKKAH